MQIRRPHWEGKLPWRRTTLVWKTQATGWNSFVIFFSRISRALAAAWGTANLDSNCCVMIGRFTFDRKMQWVPRQINTLASANPDPGVCVWLCGQIPEGSLHKVLFLTSLAAFCSQLAQFWHFSPCYEICSICISDSRLTCGLCLIKSWP